VSLVRPSLSWLGRGLVLACLPAAGCLVVSCLVRKPARPNATDPPADFQQRTVVVPSGPDSGAALTIMCPGLFSSAEVGSVRHCAVFAGRRISSGGVELRPLSGWRVPVQAYDTTVAVVHGDSIFTRRAGGVVLLARAFDQWITSSFQVHPTVWSVEWDPSRDTILRLGESLMLQAWIKDSASGPRRRVQPLRPSYSSWGVPRPFRLDTVPDQDAIIVTAIDSGRIELSASVGDHSARIAIVSNQPDSHRVSAALPFRDDRLPPATVTVVPFVRQRPDTLVGLYRGNYTSGLEESRFIPCAPITALRAPAGVSRGGSIWVTFTDSAFRNSAARWPAQVDSFYPSFYVRWRGAVIGPGTYGHLGVAAYLMRVDRVVEIRNPSPRDCD
jgi:hypothetical protein